MRGGGGGGGSGAHILGVMGTTAGICTAKSRDLVCAFFSTNLLSIACTCITRSSVRVTCGIANCPKHTNAREEREVRQDAVRGEIPARMMIRARIASHTKEFPREGVA